MWNSRTLTLFIAGIAAVTALILIVERGGLIAWSTLVLGVVLLVKAWVRPAQLDSGLGLGLGLAIGLVVVAAAAWVGTWYYVISTWESGEVTELAVPTVNGTHTARVWVLDMGAAPRVYYDAPPEIAESLIAGTPLQFTRAGNVSTRIPKATRVDAMSEADANSVLEAMGAKYGDRNNAATLYYLLLGRARDRVALVVDLVEG